MTEENLEAIEEAPEVNLDATNESEAPQDDAEPEAQDNTEGNDGEGDEEGRVEFPKKAVNALNRQKKTINKLRAQMRELEAKLESVKEPEVQSEVSIDDYETYDEYQRAQIEALVEQKASQTRVDAQKQQIEAQKQQLQIERNQYISEQAHEVAQVLPDLPQVWQENAHLLDALPDDVADVFYSIDNAPAAIYALAKEGRLEGLLYANPVVAAYEIVNAQNKGLEMMSKPKPQASQAPTPISKAKGTGSLKKQLTPNDDVLKSLGLK